MVARLLLAAVMALQLSGGGTPAVASSPQDDGVSQALTSLQGALMSGRPQDFASLATTGLPAPDMLLLQQAAGSGATSAVVRERERRPLDAVPGHESLVDVFVAHGRDGMAATWRILTGPSDDPNAGAAITGIRELSAFDGLVQLELDPTQALTVRNLTFTAPDLSLTLPTGVAFVAEDAYGITALVLLGRVHVIFAPQSPIEQGELRHFLGQPRLDRTVDRAFVRLNSTEFDRRVTGSLVPTLAREDDRRRAEAVFAERAPLTFQVQLGDLSEDDWWSPLPFGHAIIDVDVPGTGWLTYARSPGKPEDIALFDRRRQENISIYSSREVIDQRGAFYSEDDYVGYDIEHIALDVRIDPERPWLAGRSVLTLRVKSSAVTALAFKLAQTLSIVSASSPTLGRLLPIRARGQDRFIIYLPHVIEAGTRIDVAFEYQGALEAEVLGRETAISTQAPQLLDDGLDMLQRLEPRFLYSSGSAWYPQGEVSDHATAHMRIAVPTRFNVVASGIRTDQPEASNLEEPAGWRTLEFEARRPVRYLSSAISRFAHVGSWGVAVPAILPVHAGAEPLATDVSAHLFATPRQVPATERARDAVGDILSFYAEVMGTAPYEAFTLATVGDRAPAGHSPAYFAVLHQPLPLTTASWANDPVAFHQYPEFFLAHEIAHQWWGQAVGGKNYHEQWLSEGLAQYFALLYAEFRHGPEAWRSVYGKMVESAARESANGPIYLGYRLAQADRDARTLRALLYNKAAVVLHMLRQLVGDDVFFTSLRRFFEAAQFRKAGTGDLISAFAQPDVALDLNRFIDRWILGATLPRIRARLTVAPGGRAVDMTIRQEGVVFDLTVPVRIEGADGRRLWTTVPVTTAESTHRLEFDAPIRRAEIDRSLTLARVD